MAENTRISQDVELVGADAAEVSISQDANLAGADAASPSISQLVAGAAPDSATPFISQFVAGAAPDSARGLISQFVLLVSTGPLVPPPAAVRTFRFDAGNRSHYWLALQPSDSGDELRTKVVKPGRVTGKVTNCSMQFYAWDVGRPINATDVERGENAQTRRQHLPDVPDVTQSKLVPVNVPNAALHTTRVQGTWEGDDKKDRIDEIVYQIARQGVRR